LSTKYLAPYFDALDQPGMVKRTKENAQEMMPIFDALSQPGIVERTKENGQEMMPMLTCPGRGSGKPNLRLNLVLFTVFYEIFGP
ncbi:hypothetical protein M413DRAFT_445761, partial [Hebeloma cylindrosporum]